MRIQRIARPTETSHDDRPSLDILQPLFEKYRGKKGSLIPILQGAQELLGYLPTEAFEKISRETGLNISDLYGVATFYAQFRLHPVGKHIIKVCHGTACHVQNAGEITQALQDSLIIKDGETTSDRLFTLESVACLGCCSLAPVMMISGHTYGKLTRAEAVKIVSDIRIRESKAEN